MSPQRFGRWCVAIACTCLLASILGCGPEEEKGPTLDVWFDVTGHVTDSLTLSPLSGVGVYFRGDQSRTFALITRSDSAGGYYYEDLGSRPRGVFRFVRDGYRSKELSGSSVVELGRYRFLLDAPMARSPSFRGTRE
jgi:hypothetical protein